MFEILLYGFTEYMSYMHVQVCAVRKRKKMCALLESGKKNTTKCFKIFADLKFLYEFISINTRTLKHLKV